MSVFLIISVLLLLVVCKLIIAFDNEFESGLRKETMILKVLFVIFVVSYLFRAFYLSGYGQYYKIQLKINPDISESTAYYNR